MPPRDVSTPLDERAQVLDELAGIEARLVMAMRAVGLDASAQRLEALAQPAAFLAVLALNVFIAVHEIRFGPAPRDWKRARSLERVASAAEWLAWAYRAASAGRFDEARHVAARALETL